MTSTIRELLTLPTEVHQGDFVLKLSEGVQDPEATLRDYVVTPQIEDALDRALILVRDSLGQRSSRATFLDGSFGAGKSHFMAVLYLLLRGEPAARSKLELQPLVAKHDWIDGKKFLLVPFHLIGARDLESAVLGGYAKHLRRIHPEARPPAVWRTAGLFLDAERQRELLGEEKFLAELSRTSASESRAKWGKRGGGWTAAAYEAARAAPEGDEQRRRLVQDLIATFFQSYGGVVNDQGEAFVSLDEGLGILSAHAHELGYDALILFLDELILWLASHAANRDFVLREGQKLVKLVEAESAGRPVPIVSFVARQRDLRDLVGEHVPGAEQLQLYDALKHISGRFGQIKLEDRNLPIIVEKRVLRPRDEGARAAIDRAFKECERGLKDAREVLLTSDQDINAFRQVYPFSPALVSVLVAVSSALQRNRTAIKILLQLLVERGDRIRLGEIVPVGDLWEQVAHGEEAFSEGMHQRFELARKLWTAKLRPLLESEHGVDLVRDRERLRRERDAALEELLESFERDARLLSTLLIASLVPEVEPLRNLTPARLAALNHGSIRTLIPGTEGSEALSKLRRWATRVPEIQISGDAASPTVSLGLIDVDIDSVKADAREHDNSGNRRRLVRELVFAGFGLEDDDSDVRRHKHRWRGTERAGNLVLTNVRGARDAALLEETEDWRIVIDFPFDDPGYTPESDIARLDQFRSGHERSRTIVWLPSFFSQRLQADLGELVVLEYLSRGDNLERHAQKILSVREREQARPLIDGQRMALRARVARALESAFGIRESEKGDLDESLDLAGEHVRSLWPGFVPVPPAGATLGAALSHLLDQALSFEYPDHPDFRGEIRPAALREVLECVVAATRTKEPSLQVTDAKQRKTLYDIAVPLELGRIDAGKDRFVLGETWRDRFHRKMAASGRGEAQVRDPTVGELRRAIDEPRPRGLPQAVADLVILAFAAQVGREPILPAGGSVDKAEIGKLEDDIILRLADLPSADVWRAARKNAADFLGVVVPEPLTAQSAAELARRAEEAWRPHVDAAKELPQRLQAVARQLGADAAQVAKWPRYAAAKQVVAVLDRAVGQPARALAEALAGGGGLPWAAMGASLKQSRAVLSAMRDENVEVFTRLATIHDARRTQAQAVRSEVINALVEDELVRSLAGAWAGCRQRALDVLASSGDATASATRGSSPAAAPAAGPVPTAPSASSGSAPRSDIERRDVIVEDSVHGLDEDKLLRWAKQRGYDLRHEDEAVIDIHYIIRRRRPGESDGS